MRSVGLIAEIVKPSSTVPVLPASRSFLSLGRHSMKRTPTAARTSAVTPWETGTTTGWRPRNAATPKYASAA
jgi:hypothetical protein